MLQCEENVNINVLNGYTKVKKEKKKKERKGKIC